MGRSSLPTGETLGERRGAGASTQPGGDAVREVAFKALGALLATGIGLAAAACGEAAPPPGEILGAAMAAVAEVQTVHFRLTIENGGIELVPDLVATRLEGDVAQPDRVQAEVWAKSRGITLRLEFRSIGNDQWITNPFAPEQWQRLPGTPIAGGLLDPQAGVTTLAATMEDVVLVGTESIEGVDVHRVSGRAPNASVAGFLGGAPVEGETAIELWIGVGDALVRRAELRGPTVGGDAEDVVRRIEFSRFDRPVSIVAPA